MRNMDVLDLVRSWERDAAPMPMVEILRIAAAEIARLREERKPVAWCVQADAGSMFHAWTHTPIDAAVLIQCKDEADARMMASVYGHKVLGVVDLDANKVPLPPGPEGDG